MSRITTLIAIAVLAAGPLFFVPFAAYAVPPDPPAPPGGGGGAGDGGGGGGAGDGGGGGETQNDNGFVPLVPDIPFLTDGEWSIGGPTGNPNTGFTALLNALIGISVGVAAVLAVVMLAIGGFKYMTTDAAFTLGDAKEQIRNAIFGLLIVLFAVLVLNTINPRLTSFDVFLGARQQGLPQLNTGNGGGGGGGVQPLGACPQGHVRWTDGTCRPVQNPNVPTGPGPAPGTPAGGAQGASQIDVPPPPGAVPGPIGEADTGGGF